MARRIVMPSFGMFTAEAKLSAWLRPEGARVEEGETIAEVTTDKAVHELPSPGAGLLAHVAKEGDELVIEALLGYLLEPGEAVPAPIASTATATLPADPTTTLPSSSASLPRPPGDVRASPAARRLAGEHGVDLQALTGTGPGGRIVEADVLAAASARATRPASGAATIAGTRAPLTPMRRAIATRLRHAIDTAVSLTLTREVDAAPLVAARTRLEKALGELPWDALFAKLLATALRDEPALNASIDGVTLVRHDAVDLGIAIALADGLVVPVLRQADTAPLADLAARIRDLATRARAGRLRPDELEGGTASLTNLGGLGIDAFTPILNPPQSAILGIGRIAARPVVRDGAIVAGTTAVLSLTFDHRVADGADAARLLGAIAARMTDAAWLDSLAATEPPPATTKPPGDPHAPVR